MLTGAMSDVTVPPPERSARSAASTKRSAASKKKRLSLRQLQALYIANPKGQLEAEFLDNLSAAQHFKDFLLSIGEPVTPDVSHGIAQLAAVFAGDLNAHEKAVLAEQSAGWFRSVIKKLFSRKSDKRAG